MYSIIENNYLIIYLIINIKTQKRQKIACLFAWLITPKKDLHMEEQLTCSIPISIAVPYELLQSINYFAKEANTSRSKYIVKILKEKLENQK